MTKVGPEELLSLKIAKGILMPTYRSRESKTYFVQNNSDEERTFTVDHSDSQGIQAAEQKTTIRSARRFFVAQATVAAHKTGLQEVVEERTHQNLSHPLPNASEESLRTFLASPAVNAKVQVALKKYLNLQEQVTETRRLLDEQKSQLKILTDDQARLRENLKIIPPTSDPYKGFLQKFVAQESEIDGYQKQIRQLEAALLKQQRTLETFVQWLTGRVRACFSCFGVRKAFVEKIGDTYIFSCRSKNMRVRQQLLIFALMALITLVGLVAWHNNSPGANQADQDHPNQPQNGASAGAASDAGDSVQ